MLYARTGHCTQEFDNATLTLHILDDCVESTQDAEANEALDNSSRRLLKPSDPSSSPLPGSDMEKHRQQPLELPQGICSIRTVADSWTMLMQRTTML